MNRHWGAIHTSFQAGGYLSSRIAVMERGKLVEIGEAEAICAHPQMPHTQKLRAATPELPA